MRKALTANVRLLWAHTSPWIPSIALAGLLGAVAAIAFERAYHQKFDFHHFYLDARYVWEHGQLNPDLTNAQPLLRRQLPFYLPTVSLLLAPLTFGGPLVTAILWGIGQALCLYVCMRSLSSWTAASSQRAPVARPLVIASTLAIVALWEAAKFNQLTFPILAMLLGAFSALRREHPVRAGVLFALAAVVKLLPAVFIVWLALKRQWTALAACVVAAAVVTLLPPATVFGYQHTVQYHQEWWQHNVHGAPAEGMTEGDLVDHFIDRRNQGLPVVLARIFSPDQPYHVAWQPIQLTAETCTWLARGILVAMLAALIWCTSRPWRRLTAPQHEVEFAAYLVAMMVFAPLLRQYYLAWSLPALLCFVHLADRVGTLRRIGGWGIAVWLLGMLAWTNTEPRICGADWLMLALMGSLLLAAQARSGATATASITNEAVPADAVRSSGK